MGTNILGAGLSGLASGIKLLQSNVEVSIFEKKNSIGQNIDGIQAIRNYENEYDQIEFFNKKGLNFKHFKPIFNIKKFSPSGKCMTVESQNNKPIFYSFKRGEEEISLENQLYKQANELGAKIEFNTNKLPNNKDIDIIAIGGIYNNIWAFGSIYQDIDIDPETILFFMDNNYCPKGYIYFIPFGKSEATVAATTFNKNTKIPKLFDKFIKENKVMKEILDGATFVKHTFGFEYSNIPHSAEINRKKIIGSSAGFLDPSRGFGIKYALWSGILASESITENKNYDELWKNAFEEELLENFKRRFLLERMSNEDFEKWVIEDKISISKYENIPNFLKNNILKIKLSLRLKNWRKKYDLNNIFNGDNQLIATN